MRRGFTLIELLVVIAIIAILAAILFPVFIKARDKAKTSTCVAHGRQLGQACTMYMDDYNGRFPSEAPKAVIAAAAGGPWVYNWANLGDKTWDPGLAQFRLVQLRKYVKNDAIWICPNPATFYGKRYAFGYRCSWLPRNSDHFVDGDRGFWNDVDKVNGLCVGRSISEVQALDAMPSNECGSRVMPPSKKIMWMCYGLGEWAIGRVGNPDWPKGTFPSCPHNGGSTYVYADGHASWKKMGKAWAPIGYTKLWMDEAPTKS